MEARIEAAAKADRDRPASDLLEPGGRWNPLLNAFSAAYNGAAFDHISVKDYAAYDGGEENWRVPMGYGAAMARAGAELPVRLSSAVRRIEHGGTAVRLVGDFGGVEASAVIVTVPPPLLISGEIAFDPPLPAKHEAATALPLGCAAKAFLLMDGPEAKGPERMLYTEPLGPQPAAIFLRGGGRPTAELYVGGGLAAELEAAGEAAFCAFATDRMVEAFGGAIRARLRPLTATAWRQDPWSRGAYSYARVGEHGARAALAEPVDRRLFFAGEATHTTMFSTAHGAHDTGVAAAQAALSVLTP